MGLLNLLLKDPVAFILIAIAGALFMGARTLKEHWPTIARWIVDQ